MLLAKLPEKAEILDKVYELEQKSDQLRQAENNLHDFEVQLRIKYPKEAPLIQDKVIFQLPWIYAITPTYTRLVQKAELKRIAQSLIHVKNFHWIVVEDSKFPTELVANLLSTSGLKFTHLNASTPEVFKMNGSDPNWLKPRGVVQRNEGLDWLRRNRFSWRDKGVVYFLDDDNTYDTQLFEEMRFTDKVSVWPVGLVGALLFERPLVNASNQVVGWHSGWKPKTRPFAMDMAGFAINLKLILHFRNANFSLKVKRGWQEGTLLALMKVRLSDLEPRADNCTRILVWHTRTEKPDLKMEARYQKLGRGSDLSVEV